MTKISLTIVFLLLTPASASAAGPVTIQFDGLCDTVTLTKDKPLKLFGTVHQVGCTGANKHLPASNPIPGVGIVVKGGCDACRSVSIGETLPDDTGASHGYLYLVQYPLVTGGRWSAYATSDGKTIAQVSGGTYTVK